MAILYFIAHVLQICNFIQVYGHFDLLIFRTTMSAESSHEYLQGGYIEGIDE